MFAFLKNKFSPISVETQLATLRECGIACVSPAAEQALLRSVPRATLERQPYASLLAVMGDEDEAGSYYSDNVWYFNSECIASQGDYVEIIRRLAALSHGDLVISDLADFIDVENETAWVSFRCNGVSYRWDAEVNDDWADDKIFSRFAALLAPSGSARRYLHINDDRLDCVIACLTAAQTALLTQKTGFATSLLE